MCYYVSVCVYARRVPLARQRITHIHKHTHTNRMQKKRVHVLRFCSLLACALARSSSFLIGCTEDFRPNNKNEDIMWRGAELSVSALSL